VQSVFCERCGQLPTRSSAPSVPRSKPARRSDPPRPLDPDAPAARQILDQADFAARVDAVMTEAGIYDFTQREQWKAEALAVGDELDLDGFAELLRAHADSPEPQLPFDTETVDAGRL
jgi:hypothetical protein